MDVMEKAVELSDIQVLQREIECVKRKSSTNCTDCLNCDLLMPDERILTAYKNAIDALQNEQGVTVQEWVSVEDRLLEPKENVICINRHRDMMIGTYTEWGWMFPCYFEWPTHWMPIPKPPKGE